MEIPIKYKKKKKSISRQQQQQAAGMFPFFFFFISNYCVEIRHSIEEKDQSTSQRSVLLL
jgi:hypothetical protein